MPQPLPSGLVCFTCRALQRSPTYPSTLKEHAGYSEASIRNCVQVRTVPAYVLSRPADSIERLMPA